MDLIERAEVKKRFPIMENEFGMVVNKTLNKELDKIPTVDAVPMSLIDDVKTEIERKANSGQWSEGVIYGMLKAIRILEKKVEEFK